MEGRDEEGEGGRVRGREEGRVREGGMVRKRKRDR